ncbi:Lsr2 family DNA-binding protein [Streptomyces xanthochromogenes]|uniref:Lsr2 family DNA-binding protein n=1 Tax=Streptomyces xanthochromogenes TaxID=67384 RepID=UPI00344A0587
MFTDWAEALDAETLPLEPNSAQQLAAAARLTARRSHDKGDMELLLDVLGLPTAPDTLTALLPLIPKTGDAPMPTTTTDPVLSAFAAMAISMQRNGDDEQTILEATGLSKSELSDLIADQTPGQQPDAVSSPAVVDVPVVPRPVTDTVQALLDWAATHPAASVRSRAARITAALAELSERRDSEAAQREAEKRVAKAKAELERAQEELRTMKAGTRASVATSAPTPPRGGVKGSGRSSEELAAIRVWARTHGHRVSAVGVPRKAVLEAYDAAHQTPARKAG